MASRSQAQLGPSNWTGPRMEPPRIWTKEACLKEWAADQVVDSIRTTTWWGKIARACMVVVVVAVAVAWAWISRLIMATSKTIWAAIRLWVISKSTLETLNKMSQTPTWSNTSKRSTPLATRPRLSLISWPRTPRGSDFWDLVWKSKLKPLLTQCRGPWSMVELSS